MPTSLASPLPHPPAISAALTAPAPPRPPSRRGKAIDDLEMSTAVDAEVSDFFGSNLNPESAPPAETARERFSTKERVATRREIAREIGGALRAGGRRRPPAPLRTPGSSYQPSPTTPISVLGAPWRRICGWTCRAERRAECPRREAPVTRHGAGAVPAPLSRALAHGQTRWRVVSSLSARVCVCGVCLLVCCLSQPARRGWPVRAVTVPPPCATATNSP